MNNGGPVVHPQKSKKNRLQMVQSELFWSFIFLLIIFFWESGATPVFPEQLASMCRAGAIYCSHFNSQIL